ncbi:MAG: hypothetical protein JXR95_02605 [Deltaproteobacteria bacterium]|nr:hypothetical protein [Deltaproteobacteria bacterium]
MFISLISSDQVKKPGKLIEKRLGRKLEPYDIWYDGFKARSTIPEKDLTAKTGKKYSSAAAFHSGINSILTTLGFSTDKAAAISSKIQVDPSRGAGHAWGAQMRTDKSHLRTRLTPKGMDYKGYNIAIHELGHNVEQTISLQDVDYYILRGVPNTAFTEAWAFIFQKRDLELLEMKDSNPQKEHLSALNTLWSAFEIMGVSLVDMKVWNWLYKHPNADKTTLKNAVVRIARQVWNKYFHGIFPQKDVELLAVYSHMIDYPLYLPAYPIGHIAEFQIEQQISGKNLGSEMTRICSKGKIVPDLWMKNAAGKPLGISHLINAAQIALKHIK